MAPQNHIQIFCGLNLHQRRHSAKIQAKAGDHKDAPLRFLFKIHNSKLPHHRPLHPKRKTAAPAEKVYESWFTVHLHSSELPMKLNNSFTHTIPAGYPNNQPNCSSGMTSARFARASLITSLSADTTKTCSPVSANERQLSSSSIRLSARCFSFWPPPE